MSQSLAIEKAVLPKIVAAGVMRFGDIEINCGVLADGTRGITQRGLITALTGGAESSNLERYTDRIPNRPKGFTCGPVLCSLPGGGTTKLISAAKAVEIFSLYAMALSIPAAPVDASDKRERLHPSQYPIAHRCLRIMLALGTVGFNALIDEASGYAQRQRVSSQKMQLEEKIRFYLHEGPQKSPHEYKQAFFKQFCRLNGYHYDPSHNHPAAQLFIRRYIYDHLDKDVAREQKLRNPNPQRGRNMKDFWTDDTKPLLRAHINTVLALMTGAQDMDDFKRVFKEFFCTELTRST